MSDQGIDLPGVRNARELGGYRIGNRTVRKGILLRSGSLFEAADEAKSILANRYHLQTIIDFRMTEETLQTPDPVIAGVHHLKLPMLETVDMDEPDPEFVAVYSDPSADAMVKFEITYQKQIINHQSSSVCGFPA